MINVEDLTRIQQRGSNLDSILMVQQIIQVYEKALAIHATTGLNK